MHLRAEAFRERAAERFDIDLDVRELEEPTRTAEDAARAVGASIEQVLKSVVMLADESPVVVLTAGHHRVDEKALREALGASSVRAATPEEIADRLGWSIGGVPPFGYEEPVRHLLDPSLRDADVVWAGAGTPNALVALDPQELERITEAEVVDVFE
jgi:prolyl-tRNA editing enzyme YbaK/EbsC (Cys-tRNA(Pro) deacylase)